MNKVAVLFLLKLYSVILLADNMKLYKEDIETIERIKLMIANNSSRHFTIVELCIAAGMGATKFKKAFKQLTGFGPYTFRKDHRMNYAYELITESEYPIKAIAKKCGFSHVGNFSAAFKKRFGRTAGSFREGTADAQATLK